MRAYVYNNLVKEYKRRIAMNESIMVTLESATGYYLNEAQKEYDRNASIAADLKHEILSVNKEDIVYA